MFFLCIFVVQFVVYIVLKDVIVVVKNLRIQGDIIVFDSVDDIDNRILLVIVIFDFSFGFDCYEVS